MIVLPIVGRELRVAARRPMTYRIRFGASLAALVLLTWQFFWSAAQFMPPAQQGRRLFITISVLGFFYCLFAGVRATSDCVSEEKREGTLGLLFLTDLRGFDIVLGKLAATSLNSLYGVLAIFPALAMPLLLGGVTLAEFAGMVLVMLNTLLFSLAIGLLVSTLSRNERKAAFFTAASMLAPTVLPITLMLAVGLMFGRGRDLYFLDYLSNWWFNGRTIEQVFATEHWSDGLAYAAISAFMAAEVVNPIYAFLSVLFGATPLPVPVKWTSPQLILISVGAIHVLSWLALAAAALALPHVWKDRAAGRLRRSWREIWTRFSQGAPSTRASRRAALLRLNPYLWLQHRDRLKPWYGWVFLVAMVALWGWRYAQESSVMFDFYPLVPTVMMVHAFFKIWVVAEAGHRLMDDQRSGALELLLSTPLGIGEMVEGQWRALRRQFAIPMLLLCGAELLAFSEHYPPVVVLLTQVLLVADMVTMMWVSMWLSLAARNLNHLMVLATGLVLAVPVAVAMILTGLLQALTPFARLSTENFRIQALVLAGASAVALWVGLHRGPARHGRALLIALLMVAPWCIELAVECALRWRQGPPRWYGIRMPFEHRVLVWFLGGMVVNVALVRWAQTRLMRNFRVAVLRRFERSPDAVPSWRRWAKPKPKREMATVRPLVGIPER